MAKGRALVPQPHGGALLPGAGRGPAKGRGGRPTQAYRIRAQKMLEDANALEYLKNVIVGLEGDTIAVKRIVLMEEKVGDQVVKRPVQVTEFQQIPAAVRDRIDAIETLEAAAGYKTRPAAPTPVVQAQYVIFAPAKAKTTTDWLKMHRLGKA